MNFSPKGLLFWAGLFAAATCVALDHVAGVFAFLIFSLLVFIWG